jgi:hypothetical protein
LRSGEGLERALLELTRRGYPHILLRVGRAPATTPTRRRRLVDMIAGSV